jgi:hypothetical protein
MKRMILPLLLLAIPCVAGALEVTLDSVVGNTRSGVFGFRLYNKAVFDFDPATQTLTSAGTWFAQNSPGGPMNLRRYSHQVENFSASVDRGITYKSYECVEGTFATMLATNVCGNYRFGPNLLDDGGLGDDEIVGPPKSLDHYELSQFNWDGSALELILSLKNMDQADVFPELSLTLTFSATPETDAAGT